MRVDTHIVSGSRIPPFYDSLMAKIIVHAADRPAALERMRQRIAATRIEGVATNLAFHAAVLADPEFQAGGVDTSVRAALSRTASSAERGQQRMADMQLVETSLRDGNQCLWAALGVDTAKRSRSRP